MHALSCKDNRNIFIVVNENNDSQSQFVLMVSNLSSLVPLNRWKLHVFISKLILYFRSGDANDNYDELLKFMELLCRVCENIILDPKNERFRRLKIASILNEKKYSRLIKLRQNNGNMDILKIFYFLGFSLNDNKDHLIIYNVFEIDIMDTIKYLLNKIYIEFPSLKPINNEENAKLIRMVQKENAQKHREMLKNMKNMKKMKSAENNDGDVDEAKNSIMDEMKAGDVGNVINQHRQNKQNLRKRHIQQKIESQNDYDDTAVTTSNINQRDRQHETKQEMDGNNNDGINNETETQAEAESESHSLVQPTLGTKIANMVHYVLDNIMVIVLLFLLARFVILSIFWPLFT